MFRCRVTYSQILQTEIKVIHVCTWSRHGGDGAANCTADRRRTSWIHEEIPASGADKLALPP